MTSEFRFVIRPVRPVIKGSSRAGSHGSYRRPACRA